MLNLYELEQLVALADLGTLSRVSEAFHISTPSVTRSMQNLEQEFGVSLFPRSKNRIELNQTGQVAVEQARRVLAEAGQAIRQVRTFDAGRKTIRVESGAPAPLWRLLRRLSEKFPGMTISSHIGQNEEVLSALKEEACDLAILPFSISDERFQVTEYMKENAAEASFWICKNIKKTILYFIQSFSNKKTPTSKVGDELRLLPT